MLYRRLTGRIFLLALAAWGLASFARAAEPAPSTRPNPGTAAPQLRKIGPFHLATPEDTKNPAIVSPDDPGQECLRKLSPEEIAKGGADLRIGKACLPQQDAFVRAAESSSYMAHYLMYFSPFATELRQPGQLERHQQDLRDCLSPRGDCSDEKRITVIKALVQYNLGKQVRSNYLVNNTRAEKMKSVELRPEDWRELGVRSTRVLAGGSDKGAPSSVRAPMSGSLRKSTFRLDPKKLPVLDADKISAGERARLGENFQREFGSFLNEYTSSSGQLGPKSRWHYVAVKSAAVTGKQVDVTAFNYEPQETVDDRGRAQVERARVNTTRRDEDVRVQASPQVREIVRGFEEMMRKDSLKVQAKDEKGREQLVDAKPQQVAFSSLGLGLAEGEKDPQTGKKPTPQEMAASIVVTINKGIHERELEARKESRQNQLFGDSRSTASVKANTIPSVSVNLENFDRFLNDIWPSGVDRPKP